MAATPRRRYPRPHEDSGCTRARRWPGGDARLPLPDLGGQLYGGRRSYTTADFRDEFVRGKPSEGIE